jgi:chromosome segregation ATPase
MSCAKIWGDVLIGLSESSAEQGPLRVPRRDTIILRRTLWAGSALGVAAAAALFASVFTHNSERAAWFTQRDTLSAQVDQLRVVEAELQAQVDSLRPLKVEVDTLRNSRSDLEPKVAELKQRADALSGQITTQSAESRRLQIENRDLQTLIDTRAKTLKETEERITRADQVAHLADERRADAEKKASQAIDALATETYQLSELEKKRREIDGEFNQRNGEVKTLEGRKTQLQDQLKDLPELVKRSADLDQRVQQRQRELVAVEQRAKDVTEQETRLRNEIQGLSGTRDALRSAVADLQGQQQQLQSVDKLLLEKQAALAGINADLVSKRDELKRVTDTAQKAAAEIPTLLAQQSALQKEIGEQRGQVQAVQTQLDATKKSLDDITPKQQKAQADLLLKQKQVDELEGQRAGAAAEASYYTKRAAGIKVDEQHAEQLKQDIDILEGKLGELKQRIAAQNGELRDNKAPATPTSPKP